MQNVLKEYALNALVTKLKSKNFIAQKNELLCKLIAHNIIVLIHEMHELGIKPDFCTQNSTMLKPNLSL